MNIARCARCGQPWPKCQHTDGLLTRTMSGEEVTRVKARYAFGKLHNPDHDTTSYRD
jgi:hypothetical protein